LKKGKKNKIWITSKSSDLNNEGGELLEFKINVLVDLTKEKNQIIFQIVDMQS
jgi:hypothetical protein